jgi:hypothetical protein
MSAATRSSHRLERILSRLEAAEWGPLAALATACAAVGAVAALAGAYPPAFAAVVGPLAIAAYRSIRLACVLVALTSPLVALGSVDVGFHVVPSYVLVGAGLLGALRRREWRALKPVAPDWVLAAFLAVAVTVSVANAGVVPDHTVVAAEGANSREVRWIAQLAALLAMAGLYALVRMGTRTPEDVAAIMRALLVAAGLVVVYVGYQTAGHYLDLPYDRVNERRSADVLRRSGYARPFGTLTEASTMAHFMLIPLCAGAAALVAGARRPSWLGPRVAGAAALGGAAAVLASLSKSGLFATLLVVPVVVLLARGVRIRGAMLLLLVPLALAGSLALWGLERGNNPTTLLQRERHVRVGYWIAAARMIEANPAGIGVGNYTFHYPREAPDSDRYEYHVAVADAHNLFLEAAAETGLLGGLLFLAFAVVVVREGLRAAGARSPPWIRPVAVAISLALAAGLLMHLTFSFFYFPYEWVLLGLAASLPGVAAARGLGSRSRPNG